MDGVKVIRRNAEIEEFIEMRKCTGWGYPEEKSIGIGLKNTLFSVCVELNDEIIGYGRLIGDGAFTFYIQDVIVKPKYQGKGIGSRIIDEILSYIRETYTDDNMVCLMSAKGKEAFYKKFGFIERPNENYGPGMILGRNK